MVLKKKHRKILQKSRQKRTETKEARNESEIDFDTSAYVIYDRLETTYPCLSFDIVTDSAGYDADRVTKFPLSMYLVAGAQTPPNVESNYIYVMKADNVKQLKQENDESDSENEAQEGEDADNLANLTSIRVAHKGCVNRIRANKIGGRTLTATWSDKGKVHIYDLTTPIQAVADRKSINTYTAQKIEPKPIFTFGGHLSEGYAIDWCTLKDGSIATGDCKKNIHVWTMKNNCDWNVDQQPLVGHQDSVEDIKWSPENENLLLSCSVDKSIRLWDLRNKPLERCVVTVPDSHASDVNVIDWNRKTQSFIVSGGDDGAVKIWDTRMIMTGQKDAFPLAQFNYHKKPITCVEWDPNDDTVIAVGSEDDKITIWDLAVERDIEQENAEDKKMDTDENNKDDDDDHSNSEKDDEDMDEEKEAEEEEQTVEYEDLKDVPDQMLFLHQGQNEIKELHWHPQLRGLLISTALNGMNIFKTISA